MVPAMYPQGLNAVLDIEVVHKCLCGINSCHKAVLRGKSLEKRSLIKSNDIISKAAIIYLIFSSEKNLYHIFKNNSKK